MFQLTKIKNFKRRSDDKIVSIGIAELMKFTPEEHALPYFSIVPEQVFSDLRYNKLSRQDKGDFLRLIIILWKEECRHINHPGAIGQKLEMSEKECSRFIKRLVDVELIYLTADNNYIIQPELREQYLQTLQANNNKRRLKE